MDLQSNCADCAERAERAECAICAMRSTIREQKLKKALTQRLSRIEGQVRGVNKMLENDAYCDDILNQIAAAKAALDGAARLVLESHLRGCVAERLKSGDDSAVNELLDTLKKLM